MKKTIFLFIMIFCVFQKMVSLEFHLEYEQRLDDDFLANQKNIHGTVAFFVNDTTLVIYSYSILGSRLFLLNYIDNTIQEKSLEFIEGFTELKGIIPVDQENTIVICHYEKRSFGENYVVVNLNDDSYFLLSYEEQKEKASKSQVFLHPYGTLNSNQWISENHQLYFFKDEDTHNDWWWIEQSFFKIAFVQSEIFIQSHDYMGLDHPKITKYIQTLKKTNGESLIIPDNASVCYDSNREKLIILAPCELDSKGEPDMDTDTLFIYKLIRDATCNDTRVRIREEPNLSCATLSHLNPGDAVKIIDKSDEPLEIDGETWYWYKVESDMLPDGWVYGKYLDIEE